MGFNLNLWFVLPDWWFSKCKPITAIFETIPLATECQLPRQPRPLLDRPLFRDPSPLPPSPRKPDTPYRFGPAWRMANKLISQCLRLECEQTNCVAFPAPRGHRFEWRQQRGQQINWPKGGCGGGALNNRQSKHTDTRTTRIQKWLLIEHATTTAARTRTEMCKLLLLIRHVVSGQCS